MKLDKISTFLILGCVATLFLPWFGYDQGVDVVAGWHVMQYSPIGIMGICILILGPILSRASITAARGIILAISEIYEMLVWPTVAVTNSISITESLGIIHIGFCCFILLVSIIAIRSIIIVINSRHG